MNTSSSPSPRPGHPARRLLAALALASSALPALAEVSLTFATGPDGFGGSGAAWSAKFGGSLSVTNTSNWSIAAELGISGAVNDELNLMMTNGGVLEFDLIVDADGLAAGDSVSPVVAANSSGGWDQENNFPRVTAAEVAGGPVTHRVSRLIMPNDPFINNDGELHYASTSAWRQLNFGRSDSNGTTTYHIDNLVLRANATPLPVPNPLQPEVVAFAADTAGFAALPWDATATNAHSSAFGGTLQVSIPAASASKNFWWVSSASMSAKFGQKLNAARAGGGVFSYDLIAPSGTLASHIPFVYFQQGSGSYTWTQQGGTAIDPARIVDLGGGFEKTTVELTVASFNFATDNLYATLGFGIARASDAPALTYYIDNVTIAPAQPSAALAFDTDAEHFSAILDARVLLADSTAASATVTVDNATGLAVGMIASGNVNLPEGATILAIAGTTVTLSAPALATAAGVQTTFTAPVNPSAAWSETYGGTLGIATPGGPGESSRWVVQGNLDQEAAFNVAFNQVLTAGGTLSYDLIANTGVLSTLKPRIFAQQQSGAWTWVDNASSATFISPADIVALPSGRELTRVTVPTSALAAPLTGPYTRLGLGVTYTSASPVAFHLDNLQVETALVPTTSGLAFDASLEDFVPYLLGGVVHWTRIDSGAAGNGKSLLISGAPRGQQWLARATLGTSSTAAAAKAVGARLAAASANGGSLSFDVVVDDFSVTNPTADFAAAGLGVKLSLQTVGAPFQQKLFTIPATLPLPSGASVVTTLTVPLYKNGSSATDGFVLATGTEFEVLLGSVCPEKLIATADTATTSGSAVVTLADTAGISAGLTVSGAGLPNAVTVASVDSPTQLTLSAAATASGVIVGATYTQPVADRVDLIIDNLRVTANPDAVAPVISSPPKINLDGQWIAGRVLAAFAQGATYSATGLPPGLSLDPATGILSGRPTANGSFTVTFTVTTAAGVATSEVSWAVTGAATPNLVITSFNVVAGAATLQWTGAAGIPVTVQRSTDLVTWTDLATSLTAETYTDPAAPTPKAFYRVVIP